MPPVRPAGPPTWPRAEPLVQQALERAFSDGSWGRYHGPNCTRLIEVLREIHGCDAVLCSSGTAAVELALRGLGLGAGDEVLMSAYDFSANFANVCAVGALPVLVDVHSTGWNLDVDQLPLAVSPKSRAILVSHLHGLPVNIPAVREFAGAHQLSVIEDACQMPGATLYGQPAGTAGDVGVLSFGGSKLTTAGRGGALLTARADILQRVRLYTQRGNDAYPLSELQAAVLVPQWSNLLTPQNAQRLAAVELLRDLLNAVDGLTVPEAAAETSPVYYKLGMTYDPEPFGGLSRDDFAAAMRAEGIALDRGFRSLHLTHSARRFRAVGDLANSTRVDASLLTLHHPLLLEGEDSLQQVVQAALKLQSIR